MGRDHHGIPWSRFVLGRSIKPRARQYAKITAAPDRHPVQHSFYRMRQFSGSRNGPVKRADRGAIGEVRAQCCRLTRFVIPDIYPRLCSGVVRDLAWWKGFLMLVRATPGALPSSLPSSEQSQENLRSSLLTLVARPLDASVLPTVSG